MPRMRWQRLSFFVERERLARAGESVIKLLPSAARDPLHVDGDGQRGVARSVLRAQLDFLLEQAPDFGIVLLAN